MCTAYALASWWSVREVERQTTFSQMELVAAKAVFLNCVSHDAETGGTFTNGRGCARDVRVDFTVEPKRFMRPNLKQPILLLTPTVRNRSDPEKCEYSSLPVSVSWCCAYFGFSPNLHVHNVRRRPEQWKR